MDEAKSHQSVDWGQYFNSIARECPWSLRAYQQGVIDTQPWQPHVSTIPTLGSFEARVWIMPYANSIVEAMCEQLDAADAECEWLFSYPGYGAYATPVPVLIQQNRARLNQIRSKLAK